MTPIASGGVPPNGLDMNGILKAATAPAVWFSGGGGFPFDSAWSTAVGGYPQGARVLRTDGSGYWLNTVDNNTTDPESSGGAAAGWVPDTTYGIAPVTLAASDVTLTAAQYGKPIIRLSGTLTANVNLNFPAIVGQWLVVNNCSGAFSVTCKTLAGSGVIAPPSSPSKIYGDATNVYMSNASTAAITSLTGDVTASGPGSATATLAASGVAPGSYSGANITVDSKGRVTSASSSTPPFTGTSGHQILDSGLILQWATGSQMSSVGSETVPWAIEFPNACFGAWVSTITSGGNGDGTNLSYFHMDSWSPYGSTVSFHRNADHTYYPATPVVWGIGF
jgi:hypothetical protein